MKSFAKIKRTVFIHILTVINITNATMEVKRRSVFVHPDYFSVQIISTVIGQPMSFVQIPAPMIQPLQHQIPQNQIPLHQIRRHQILQHLSLQHQSLQHQIHQRQLVVKLMKIFVKIMPMVFILLQTVPSTINVSTVACPK